MDQSGWPERLQSIIDRSPVVVLSRRIGGAWPTDFVSENVRQFGYSPQEFLNHQIAWSSLTHPEDAPRVDEEIAQHLAAGRDTFYQQYRLLARSGAVRWVEGAVLVCRDGQGRATHLDTVLLDVTERVQGEAALRQSGEQIRLALQRAERLVSLGTLAAGIAHEVNNPLGAILLLAETAYQRASTVDPLLETALEQIRQQAIRCGQIVQSVLQFARQQKSEKCLARLDESIQRAADFTRHLARQQKVALVFDLDREPPPPLLINPTEMEQVFVNLISNGVQACQAGGRVCVRARARPGEVEAVVENDGPAMSAEQASRIFDPFYTTRAEVGGTGLGLSIVRGIIQDHGGRIRVESSPGQGTRFILSFSTPAANAAGEPG